MGKEAHLPYMFGFLGVNGRQIYPFYSFTPPSKHGPWYTALGVHARVGLSPALTRSTELSGGLGWFVIKIR